MPRKNKSKQEVVVDIKAAQETERVRKLVREEIYPFLLQLNESIGFTKVFLQVMATTVESTFEASKKEMKVKDFMSKYQTLFKEDVGHNKMYLAFLEKFGEETISTFVNLLQIMPRHIERYFTQAVDKKPILDLPINEVLG